MQSNSGTTRGNHTDRRGIDGTSYQTREMAHRWIAVGKSPVDPAIAGALHRVSYYPQRPTPPSSPQALDSDEDVIYVRLWPDHSGTLHVDYWRQSAIMRCGSGTLAAACALSNGLLPNSRAPDQCNDFKCGALLAPTGSLAWSQTAAHRFSFTDRALPQQNESPPACLTSEIAGQWLGCGTQYDYWLVALGNEAALAEFRLDSQRWSNATTRALIATAPTGKDAYALRYFAPQYGIVEDTLTGSAHVQAARYWSRRWQCKQLTAKQLSARGGALTATVNGASIMIEAHCERIGR